MNHRENLPVVDSNDKFMYCRPRDDVHRNKLFHRGVHIFVEGFKGRFVVQKKAAHTENGGKWSSSASGHVQFGETYRQAAVRELKEELGLDEASEHDLMEVCKMSPYKESANEFVVLFLYLMSPDEKISLGSDEVDGLIVCPRKDLMKDVEENMDDYSPVFVELLNRLSGLGGANDANTRHDNNII
jgi:isopentenyldiphosphate isomerase